MSKEKVTKEDFQSFEDVFKGGYLTARHGLSFNMSDPRARRATGLNGEVYLAIRKHYAALKEEFSTN